MFNFESLDILCNEIRHTNEMLWPFEFRESFRCSISSVSIYYSPKSDLRVKSYDHLNFSRASIVQFQVSQYIFCVNHTFEVKVMAVWICLGLPCLILRISIYYAPKSNIWVKSYSHLSCSRASVVQFQVSRYIICLNRTFGSKVMAIWICLAIPSLISSISIYYAPELHLRVKSYDHLNFSRAFDLEFQASWYIIGLNRTSESKVMAIWICCFLVMHFHV